MKTLVLANQKGGVGKSALGTQFAYYLRAAGLRTLFVDLDHQQNSSKAILKSGRAAAPGYSSSDLLVNGKRDVPNTDFVIVPGDDRLSSLEREPSKHNDIAGNLQGFLADVSSKFDVCLVDTNPNPDIRYASALITGDFVLSPIQLNQEAIDGIASLLKHPRYGYFKIKELLNPKLELIGIMPNMVENTPFQKGNFQQLAQHFAKLLIPMDDSGKSFAFVAKRSVIAEAQAEGAFIADIKKTAARDAWREIKPAFEVIARRMKLEV